MKILVVGSEGFIGSHCVRFLKVKGHDVTGCDILDRNKEDYIKIASLSGEFNKIFADRKFDFCINAAGSAHVNYSFQFPEKDFELNVFLVISLLGAIKNNQPSCKFINFSSAAVYGNPATLPVKETDDTKPLSPYGYHKLLSEKLLYEYYKFFDLKTCSLRVFSAYGEGLKKQLFWDLYQKVSKQQKTLLFGTGKESRDFIYIQDLLNIVELVMNKASFEGEVYNVANGEEVFIKDAVTAFMTGLGSNVEILFSGEAKIGDPLNWKADVKRILELGYVRSFSFAEGINRYCKWLKEEQ